MKILLVTTCTNRKTVPTAERIQASLELPRGSQEHVTEAWKGALRQPYTPLPARDLYCGRGFSEALAAEASSVGKLWIISGGLGLVAADELVPPYDLTLSPGSPNSIQDRVKGTFDPARWWSDLARRRRPKRTLAALAKDHPDYLIAVAVSGSYLELIAADLLSLPDDDLARLRLIGPVRYEQVPDRLRTTLLPYDARLNGPDSEISGTRADFPQRALRHFVDNIWPDTRNSSAAEHAAAVESLLANHAHPSSPKRQQYPDDELIRLIIKFWDRADGQAGRMLRLLRDDENIACEQGRFSRLFKVAAEQAPGNSPEVRSLTLRAVRTTQANGVDVYSFFIPGALITKIADISRIHRDDHDVLEGFQRKEIRKHVSSIIEYLDQGAVLFPNSITLALSPEVEFKHARGRDPEGALESSQAGTLHIPLRAEGSRVAWIVDGQQRSLALARTTNHELNVPVVAFVADDLETQREQFILVNKAKPLPTRLINELLPEVDTTLPRDLATRKLPSALCDLLNRDPESPFFGLIKRLSQPDADTAVVTDGAIIDVIRVSMQNPLGALAQYRALGHGSSDADGMYRALVLFWKAVKETFPDAWGKPPNESRLMHSAGLRAMGVLMDKIVGRASMSNDPIEHIRESLQRIAPHCRWTEGVWESLGLPWNEVQQTTRHVKQLSDLLSHLDYAAWAHGRMP